MENTVRIEGVRNVILRTFLLLLYASTHIVDTSQSPLVLIALLFLTRLGSAYS